MGVGDSHALLANLLTPCRALLAGLLFCIPAWAKVERAMPLPPGEPSAEEVARQVYFANHFYSFDNFSIARRGRDMALLITRNADGKIISSGVERHLNNDYQGSNVAARDLAVFRSGKLRGMGILVTEFAEEGKTNAYSIWLPELRKVRRFAQPEHDALWGGSVFTFGDVTLRRPEHETHELIGRKPLRTCLGAISDMQGRAFAHVRRLPKKTCRHVAKDVYGLKSTTRFPDWWYDYRISFVDTQTFADYRTLYFKDGRMVKVIDRDWGLVTDSGKNDPRALFWKSWYGLDLTTGRESWAVVPQANVEFDTDRKANFWSERTLRRLKR